MKTGTKAKLAKPTFREARALARNIGEQYGKLQNNHELARLLESQGRRKEARTMLAESKNGSPRLDTADLIDAKGLL